MVSKKRNPNYQKLNEEQNKLKSILHKNLRTHYNYKLALSQGNKVKIPVTMAALQKQEDEINIIRKKINKTPVQMIKTHNQMLKALKGGSNGR